MDNTIQSASDISRADHDLYADRLYQLIWQLWSNVIARRAPAVPSDIVTSGRLSIPDDVDSSVYLQAISIWFQLRKIADDNIAVRNRREQEKQEGSTAGPGSFEYALRHSPDRNLDDLKDTISSVLVGPTITAHPTETKRVTILEIHRRIYRGLVSLETELRGQKRGGHLVRE